MLGMELGNLNLKVHQSYGNPIIDYLDTLAMDSTKIVSKADERGGGQYVVNLKNSAQVLQMRILETIIREKFGALGFRIFKLLMEKKKLDDKQVISSFIFFSIF